MHWFGHNFPKPAIYTLQQKISFQNSTVLLNHAIYTNLKTQTLNQSLKKKKNQTLKTYTLNRALNLEVLNNS